MAIPTCARRRALFARLYGWRRWLDGVLEVDLEIDSGLGLSDLNVTVLRPLFLEGGWRLVLLSTSQSEYSELSAKSLGELDTP